MVNVITQDGSYNNVKIKGYREGGLLIVEWDGEECLININESEIDIIEG